MECYCNCCDEFSTQPCPAQTPPCVHKRTEMCGKQKLEPQHKTQLECSVKNCQIFGVHDTEPFPDYPCPARKIKAKDPNKNSLGSPVGMIASNVNFKTEGKPADIVQARFATYLKAFARLHLNPETMWTPTLLDELMREGLALYSSSEKEQTKFDSPADIYTASERKVLREFELSGCKFHVELMRKFKLTPSAKPNATVGAKGDGVSQEVALVDLKSALKSFFHQFKYCVVSIGTLSFLVWRARDVYFVLDVCGRRLSDLYSDRDKGVAVLMCLKTLENVRHLLMGLTALPKVDTCSLREIKLVKVVTPSGGTVQRDYGLRSHQYEVINDDYACLTASLHLTLNKSDLMRNRSALPVGVTALVAIQIDHPATWNSKMLDKIICFGVNFCQACWLKCLANEPIHVEEFPCIFNLGQFKVRIDLVPRKYEGQWQCVPGYKHSELAASLEKALKAGDHKLLLQINYQMYAIWQKQSFLYLLDPYRHRILGKPGQSEVYEEMDKTASLRMFRSFDVFLNTLNHILLDSNRSSSYYIHTLKVKSVQMRDAPDEDAKLEENGETKSINEHICFEESEELCHKALGDISDYEDEDLLSDVDELELKTSSSEAEVLEEEEAGGGGLEEELEGLETSSSGEDDGGKTKNAGKGSKAGGKSKKGGGKSKKSGKGGKTGGRGKKAGGNKEEQDDVAQAPERKKAGEISAEDKQKKKTEIRETAEELARRKKAEEEEAKKSKAEQEADKLKKAKANEAKRQWDAKEEAEKKKAEEEELKRKRAEEEEAKRKKEESEREAEAKRKQKALEEANKAKSEENKTKSPSEEIKPKAPVEQTEQRKDKEPIQVVETLKQTVEYQTNESVEKHKEKEPTADLVEKDNRLKVPLEDKDKQKPSRKICHKDGAEADDESEDDFFKNAAKRFCSAPNPNRYPGYYKCPLDMAVVGSENGSYDSLCKLLQAGFLRADRILAMTPWGNFVVFRCMGKNRKDPAHIFLFDGCTCNVNRFRHLDLSIGTAGLLCFKQMHDAIEYMRRIRKVRAKENRRQRLTADEICQQYCQ